MLVEHITWEVPQRFQAEVRSGDLTQLWNALRAKYGEKVAAHISDVLRLGRMLHEDGEVMDDQHLADVLLSNAAEVYPGLAREHGERKRATRSKPELRDATALRRCRQRVRQDLDLLVTVSVDGAALARGLGALDGSGAGRSIETLNVMLAPRNSSAAVNTDGAGQIQGGGCKFVLANMLRVLVAKAFQVTVKLDALVTIIFILEVLLLMLVTKWVVLTTTLFVLIKKSIMLMFVEYTLGLIPPEQASVGALVALHFQ
ncbi:hypothetical protein Pcac1_g27599 [Phytophthora cactorum]|uniref:Uncharacterized protein n=1 Tax=Phytophthora cactorum TaxID=29920 RepID=A0A8T1G5N5_9STRA|nr:hypothetical protein Pcac1_g27599 [Phytophthora cactorum]KAG2988860.1 hypothetical protein PC118_g6469 [Phytophthora cactorum]KAG3193889.1 hypothetical protein PC128_g9840 [Phytophthora cactorum]